MVKKLLFITFLFICSLGFSQEKSIEKLVATPNPFVNNTVISFQSDKSQDIFITVKNVLGKTVFNKKVSVKNGRNSIPFERGDLKAGMYIYAIRTQKDMLSKRFVIR